MARLLLVVRQSWEDELHQLLAELDGKAFTEAPKNYGMGEAGATFNSFPGRGIIA